MGSRDKTISLLGFLKDVGTLRRKRIAAYSPEDTILWFDDIPQDLPQSLKDAYKSVFFSDNPDEIPDIWLEVRRKSRPELAPFPRELRDWIPQEFQKNPEQYVDTELDQLYDIIDPEITGSLQVDPTVPRANNTDVRRQLVHPSNVKHAWEAYLKNHWVPWSQELRSWRKIQDLYEKVDFMRRRIEEAEERYEIILAIGLMRWRDSNGVKVKRHVLTAPAEIALDAARGILTVHPATSFENFRIELDMLELQDQPKFETEKPEIESLLQELDLRAWDKVIAGKILRIVANKTKPDAEVYEDVYAPLAQEDEILRIVYAPALVLRERQFTAYEELVSRLIEGFKTDPAFQTTSPWERFISEGEEPVSSLFSESHGANSITGDPDGRLYFPLPTNDEQRRIAERLASRPYVLVKGPPGTGKSHTIANLICHLLAKSERVLVTAHAPKALAVLRDLLPGDIPSLCVTAFGSSRDDHQLLEDSVSKILARKSEWKGEQWAKNEISKLENELSKLEKDMAEVDRRLCECREAETRSTTSPGGHRGTPAKIAREIEAEKESYRWFPELADHEKPYPLNLDDTTFLGEFHSLLTQELLSEIALDIGDFLLPSPKEFSTALEELATKEKATLPFKEQLPNEQLGFLKQLPEESLGACKTFIRELENLAARASRSLGSLTTEILKDLLVGQIARWDRLKQECCELVKKIRLAQQCIGEARIDIPSEIEDAKLLDDARRWLQHLENGGWRGLGLIAPRVMRETAYIEKSCRVEGESPREVHQLKKLVALLELREAVERFHKLWPADLEVRTRDPKLLAEEICDLVEEFRALLEFFETAYNPNVEEAIPTDKRIRLAEPRERSAWNSLIEAELARRPLEHWSDTIRSIPKNNVHPCMNELEQAITARDPLKWENAWQKREQLKKYQDQFRRYHKLLDTIREAHPELATLIESNQGNPEWKARLLNLAKAWDWAATRAWLRSITNPGIYERLSEQQHQLQNRFTETIQKLAELKAWQAFFARLDDKTEQYLKAWEEAVKRIGKGTGKHAYRHRRTARHYLLSCIPKIPAWIMPLYKLWETIDPSPGAFDTIIVDEASQAGVEALLLLLLAKRIIVVGDDKQNSPEAVGVLEDDIEILHVNTYRTSSLWLSFDLMSACMTMPIGHSAMRFLFESILDAYLRSFGLAMICVTRIRH